MGRHTEDICKTSPVHGIGRFWERISHPSPDKKSGGAHATRGEDEDGEERASRALARNGVYNNPESEPPGRKSGEMHVVSYNIEKGKEYGKIRDTLKSKVEDAREEGKTVVIGLQEVKDRKMAARLSKDLGLNVAYKESDDERRAHKAVLTNAKIEGAKDVEYRQDDKAAERDAKRAAEEKGDPSKISKEPFEQRSILDVKIRAGGKDVHVLDTHLSLGSPTNNALQLEQLKEYGARYRDRNDRTVIMGDFNDDFSRKNYGNRKNEKVNDGLRDLQSRYHNTWDLAKGKNIEADDRKLTFDRALKEGIGTKDFKEAREDYLTAGSAEKKAKALDKLRNIYEDIAGRGPTHLTAGSGKGTRFDNILVSRGVLVDSWETDYGADGSDHQPVSVDIVV